MTIRCPTPSWADATCTTSTTSCTSPPRRCGTWAEALRRVDRPRLRERFDALAEADRVHEDFEYTWTNYVDVQGFYERAAAAGRAVLFTAT